MNMEMTGDASTREIDVDLLLREAENLDWASDHSVMDASRAINSESFVRK